MRRPSYVGVFSGAGAVLASAIGSIKRDGLRLSSAQRAWIALGTAAVLYRFSQLFEIAGVLR